MSISKQRPPPLWFHIFKRVGGGCKSCILVLVKNTAQQRNNRAIINRPQRAAAARAEGAAGCLGRAPGRGLSALARPLHVVGVKLQPDNRLGAGMLLAEIAGAAVGSAGVSGGEGNMAAQAAAGKQGCNREISVLRSR